MCVGGGAVGWPHILMGGQPENVHFILQTTVSTIYQFFAKCPVHTRYRLLGDVIIADSLCYTVTLSE